MGAVFCQENHTHFQAYFLISFKAMARQARQVRLQESRLKLKRIILNKNKEIHDLLEEAKGVIYPRTKKKKSIQN